MWSFTRLIPLSRAGLLVTAAGSLLAAGDPTEAWKHAVTVSPLSAQPGRHTLHSYYLTNPESPDGSRVLFFASAHPAAQVGSIVMLDRASGRETVLAEDVHTEDAHRAACQQWLSGGRRVAFHEVVGKRWRVMVVDTATLEKKVVAEDHQVGFGRPDGDLLPLYGCHWNPGPYRDLEIWNAATGDLHSAVKATEVTAKYPDWVQREFRGQSTSIFFPVLSPDLNRVIFKLAAGRGGDEYMSGSASHRQGTFCYDFRQGACIWQRNQWGHPAWHPDSHHLIEVGPVLFDTSSPGSSAKLPGIPNLSGSHVGVSPDGTLMVCDGESAKVGGQPQEWGILVGDLRGESWALLHSFCQTRGARSWRRSHPHPIFSADSRRIYYNVSDGEFTRLFVAERK